MEQQKTLLNSDDLLCISSVGHHTGLRYELVKGELIEMAPAGARHGGIANQIAFLLTTHVNPRRLGRVFAAETGFRIHREPDTVRAPDVAFITMERLPSGELPAGYMDVAPDLVVEVVSPSDSAAYVQAKVEDWLRAGVRLILVAYPDTRSVAVYHSMREATLLTIDDTLEGGPVLPDFACQVRELFEEPM